MLDSVAPGPGRHWLRQLPDTRRGFVTLAHVASSPWTQTFTAVLWYSTKRSSWRSTSFGGGGFLFVGVLLQGLEKSLDLAAGLWMVGLRVRGLDAERDQFSLHRTIFEPIGVLGPAC
jgi:hypothetical protein